MGIRERRGQRVGLVLSLLICSCSGGGGEAPVHGLAGRETVSGLTFPTGLPSPGTVNLVDAFPGLSFDRPTVLTHAGDGSGRVFIAERAGVVRVFDGTPDAISSTIVLDLSAKVLTGSERGLLGLAFDPDYTSNGFVYLRYSTSTSTPGQNHRDVTSRFGLLAGDPNVLDPASETVLLEFDQPFGNHNGGAIGFGPDDLLYLSVGDGGSQHDPQQRAQNLGELFGKVLRIAPDGSIPADNPFVGVGGGVREEIWAYGFRNPWRFSFDRDTGDLWLADVGQSSREEVNRVVRGGNYGWDIFEGSLTHENPGSVSFADTIGPIREYGHGQGLAVTGGAVYRGTSAPSLVGTYVYGDYATGTLWALVHDGQQEIENVTLAVADRPASFGEDEAGELYVLSFNGHLYRFEDLDGGPVEEFPDLLSETGLFADIDNLVAAPGVLEYDVQMPLWSDGARKRRWIALPGTATIGFDETGSWTFPVGTVLVKHFEIDTEPGVTRRLETRVLLNTSTGWGGYTYRWNAQETDAQLLDGGESETFDIQGNEGPVSITWDYPSRAQCLACHTTAAGRVLGLRTQQLNRDFEFPLRVDNQLATWSHIGMFDLNLAAPGQYEAFPLLDDPEVAGELRARAYLDVNCAHCHQPTGPTPVDIDLRSQILTSQMNAILVAPSAGDLGQSGAFLITPGHKESSVLWERLRRLDGNRMPTLGTHLVHQEAVDLVGQWIDEGAP